MKNRISSSVVVFDSAVRPSRPSRRFGSGLLPYVPHEIISHTATDEATYAAQRREELAEADYQARQQAQSDWLEHLAERADQVAYWAATDGM